MFGDHVDLQILHDSNGNNKILTSAALTIQTLSASHPIIDMTPGGAVKIYHNNSKKLETTTGGIEVHDDLTLDGTLYGGHTIKTNFDGGGHMYFRNNSGTSLNFSSHFQTYRDNNEGGTLQTHIHYYHGGYCELLHQGDSVLRTLADGVQFRDGGAVKGQFTDEGLCFGTDTAAANALNDYEEGSFTPQPWSAAGSISYSHAGDARQGRYTKIGNLVYFVIRLQLSSVSTANGQAFIIGLPFTASNRTGSVDSCHAFNINFYEGIGGLGGDTSITGRVASGQSYILLQKKGDGSSASTYSANDWSGNWSIYGSGCYHTDS